MSVSPNPVFDARIATSPVAGAAVSPFLVAALLPTKLSVINAQVSNSLGNDAGKPSSIDSTPQGSISIHPEVSRPNLTTQRVYNGIKWSIDSILSNSTTPQTAPETLFKVQSNDFKVLVVSEKVIQNSKTLKNLFSFLTSTGKDLARTPAIPLHTIDGKTLEMVFKWCESYKEDPVTGDILAKSVPTSKFDTFFDDVGVSEAFNLASAALYLDVESLIRPMTNKIAEMLNGQKSNASQHSSPGAQSSSSGPSSNSFSSPIPTPFHPMHSLSQSAPASTSFHVCSHCGAQQSCKWRDVQKPNILCNACFIYRRKYDKVRPASVAAAYKKRSIMKKSY